MPESADVLGFLDQRQDGAYPVFDTGGAVLARITVSFWKDRFEVVAADGSPLCTGKKSGFGRAFRVADASGALVVEVRSGFWDGRRRSVALADGTELVLRGTSWLSRDWSAEDATGRTVLGIEVTSSGWSLHPDAYAVRFASPLTLAATIGIVQANRMLVKASRSTT